MSCKIHVPQIQRQGLNMAEVVDCDLNPHLNFVYEINFFPSSMIYV